MGAGAADDAGVYQLDHETALIQTLDFFTPIVNDPYVFGQIAATNALSDVYAMGGRPLCAMNICCFPIKDLAVEVFREILRGGIEKVHQAGAVLAGGHSVEDPELKYGLAVTGVVHPHRLVTNAGLRPGQKLVLTKPLGTGVIATALKAGLAQPRAVEQSVALMTQLNDVAGRVMSRFSVTGATDITGFGLLGHALEMAQASEVGITLEADRVPILDQAREMARMGLVPLGSHANREFCRKSVQVKGRVDPVVLDIMADAQTSGGMLMGLEPDKLEPALEMLQEGGVTPALVGEVTAGPAGIIQVL